MNLLPRDFDYPTEPEQRELNLSRRELIDDAELELLVIRCQLGDREAFEALIRMHYGTLKRHFTKVCGDAQAADDLTQEVWLRVLRGLGGLKQPRRFRSWLFAIAHRQLMDRFRSRYRQSIETSVEVDQLPDDSPLESRQQRQEDLESALQALSISDRETLRLFYIEGLTLAEVADCLSLPVGTVKSRLHRGRSQLRELS
ncbi:MAG: RNA polymerase sigma factor [Pseudomonadota bacterium]